ncbi:hypothetical protein [Chitinolyticbacter meiyuanensis]|uniref:hypothetical protein n=1 Tax=Chitinolyticbacter meiyuanensis TaxID=682798 RepID=UPI001652A747|nr:hypothetical protein [Chitinolyticbacter meiyuanensis]
MASLLSLVYSSPNTTSCEPNKWWGFGRMKHPNDLWGQRAKNGEAMKSSMDLFNEYVSNHSQREMAALCGVHENTVGMWKARGGMTPAATVKVGQALGYDLEFVMKIALVEAERTEQGRDYLGELVAAWMVSRGNPNNWRRGRDSNPR